MAQSVGSTDIKTIPVKQSRVLPFGADWAIKKCRLSLLTEIILAI
jgi:hypothetical protein